MNILFLLLVLCYNILLSLEQIMQNNANWYSEL